MDGWILQGDRPARGDEAVMRRIKKNSGRVKVWVTQHRAGRRRSHLAQAGATGVIVGAMSAVITGTWLAIQLIVNPGAVSWVSQFFPGWDMSSLIEPPQTLTEIGKAAADNGLEIGKPIYLSTYPGFSANSPGFYDLLLPFYQPQTQCEAVDSELDRCRRMTELRVYRPYATQPSQSNGLTTTEPTFKLVDRVKVTGLEELVAIAPLTDAGIAGQGSTRTLPLTSLSPLQGTAPLPGAWFHATGIWQRGRNRVVYGRLVRYDPLHDRLQVLLNWTSLVEALPQWQQVTGSAAAELVVDQSIGLEPQFQVYQIESIQAPGRSTQVEPVTLTRAASNRQDYRQGLVLARNGLWSPALKLLQQSKQTDPQWSAVAQSQLDLVALHAKVTQAQAEQEWSSPRQQMVALLIDGQWAKAFDVLQTARRQGFDISDWLSNQPDFLWRRVEASVRVNARSTEVQNWGILLMAVRQDRQSAVAWLRQQTSQNRQSTSTHNPEQQAQQVLALLDPPASPAASPVAASPVASPAVSAAAVPIPNPTSRLLGAAIPQETIDPTQWLQPDPADELQLLENQQWYAIHIMQFQDGQQWRQSPFTTLPANSDALVRAERLWAMLGLATIPQVELIAWTETNHPEILPATIRAVQVVDADLYLLAAVDLPEQLTVAASNPRFAMTLASLKWLEPSNNLTLTELSQDPVWGQSLPPALWQELQQIAIPLPDSVTNSNLLLQEVGDWTFQLMDLTGDGQPEAVLTLQTQPEPTPNSTNPVGSSGSSESSQPPALHTWVFSSSGQVIYQDGQTGQSLKAIVDLEAGLPPILIIHEAEGYRIAQWSASLQRFE